MLGFKCPLLTSFRRADMEIPPVLSYIQASDSPGKGNYG